MADDDLVLILARLERLAFDAVRTRMAVEQLGELFQADDDDGEEPPPA
jgi:hypothetical protein